MIEGEKLIAMITMGSKYLYVSKLQKLSSVGQYQATLSERKKDAMFLDEKEDVKAVNQLFNVSASYIRLSTQEEDISSLMWRQLNA